MGKLTSIDEIEAAGFEWPKYWTIEERTVAHGHQIDLSATLEKLRSGRDFYQGQLTQAFNFKASTGADYSDFTDRFDEYARSHRQFKESVSYVENILEALAH